MLSASCWAAGCSSGHTIGAPRRNIRLGITSGNLDFAYRRAQNRDYACDLTRSHCHQEPIVIGARFAQPLEQEWRSVTMLITAIARYPLVSPGRRPGRLKHGTVRVMATKAERRAARERVSAYHESQLAGLLGHVGAEIDRYRAGEIDALCRG
jgi:hypothetical protein